MDAIVEKEGLPREARGRQGPPWLGVVLWPLALLLAAEIARWLWKETLQPYLQPWASLIAWPLVEIVLVGAVAVFCARRLWARQAAELARVEAAANKRSADILAERDEFAEEGRKLREENSVLSDEMRQRQSLEETLKQLQLERQTESEAREAEIEKLKAENEQLRMEQATPAPPAVTPEKPAEFVTDGNYVPLISRLRAGQCTEAQVLQYLHRVAQGLLEFHSRQIAYVLTPDTVLIDVQQDKIALRLRPLGKGADAQLNGAFYPGFSAPEALGNRPTPASDVFSLGALLYAFYARDFPPERGEDLMVALEHLNVDSRLAGVSYLLRKALWPYREQRLADAGSFDKLLQALRGRGEWQTGDAEDEPAPVPLLDVGADFNVGLRKGRNRGNNARDNEDRLFWDMDEGRGMYLLAVADGISKADIGSGYEAADAFARQVADEWQSLRKDGLPENPEQWLGELFEKANKKVVGRINEKLSHGRTEGRNYPMGAAACVALCHEDQATLANLGDVRAYLVTAEWAAKLTHDHTTLSEVLADPDCPPERRGNISSSELSAYVGQYTVAGGALMAAPVQPFVTSCRLAPGDSLVLVSDGAYGAASGAQELFEDNLVKMVNGVSDAQLAAFRVMAVANQRSGYDNISCIVCRRPAPATPAAS